MDVRWFSSLCPLRVSVRDWSAVSHHPTSIARLAYCRYDVRCDWIGSLNWRPAHWPRAGCTRDRSQEQVGRQHGADPVSAMQADAADSAEAAVVDSNAMGWLDVRLRL